MFALATLSFAQELIVSGAPKEHPRTYVRHTNEDRGADGPKLKGANMAGYVYFAAEDGYRVVLALAEIDTAFQENQIIAADTKDRKPLPAEQGPCRLIVPRITDHEVI